MKRDKCQVMSDALPRPVGVVAAHHASRITHHSPAFSLIELLVVISILGLLAGLALPALKDLGKSNAQISAHRQLLDDVSRARQLAMSQHTTVYMVFVPTNYFTLDNVNNANFWAGLNAMTDAGERALAQAEATNLLDKQLIGYRFMSYGRLGDQPGQHIWHYIDDKWKALPEGSLISSYKFYKPLTAPQVMTIPEWKSQHLNSDGNVIYPFQTNAVPFPTEDSPSVILPCIAFNHLGQLVQTLPNGSQLYTSDGYIPIVQGVVGYATDPNTKLPRVAVVNPADILERPPGNGTNIGYHVVHIDALTGRATLESFKLQ